MTTHATPSLRGGVPNAGPHSSRPHRRAATVDHLVLTGRLAWVDHRGGMVVLRIEDTNRRGRRFKGATVTVNLAGARMSTPDRNGDGKRSAADLLPGERVSVGVKLPRHLDGLPRVVAARTCTCESFD